jgi:uncharacterized repeat protein (TIGR03847 family)
MLRSFKGIQRFTVGTVGLPGERTFYIQIISGLTTISLSLEKSQVAALSERLNFMLKEIRLVHPLASRPPLVRDTLPLESPVSEDFRIGSIAIFYDEENELIQVDLREISLGDEELEDDSPLLDDVEIVRAFITPVQVKTFHDRAELVIAAGRQPCPFCGFPIDPQGHLCARANGYRR